MYSDSIIQMPPERKDYYYSLLIFISIGVFCSIIYLDTNNTSLFLIQLLIAGIISFIYLEATVISIPIRIIFKKSAFTLGYHFNTKREYPYICLYRIRLLRKGNGYEKNAWIKIERGIRWIKISHQAALVLIDAYRQNVGGDPPWIEEI